MSYTQSGNKKLRHLAKHFKIVGGDKAVIDASDELSEALSKFVMSIRDELYSEPAKGTF